ncbi:unnamed protein product [Calicophoron daubneyi]
MSISDSDSSATTDTEDDFEVLKKPDAEVTAGKADLDDTSPGDDADSCPICFDSWTSTGNHKLCCLRCGHLFGYSCVSKWIRSQGKQARCPQCNAKARYHDIRFLYTRNLRVLDTSERDRALADLAIERAARRKAEQDAAEHKAKYQLLQSELIQLKDELQNVQAVSNALMHRAAPHESASQGSTGSQKSGYQGQYELMKTILISSTGNCRVMAACDYLNTLVISQPSTSPIFRGFGIRKVSTIEQRPLKYIHLHAQPIRDIAFHPDAQDGILCSASLDKSLRLTSLLADQVVQTYHCPAPVWSCCWASPNPHRLFAGCSNGSVLVFDIRVTSGPITTLTVPENGSPVIGLQYCHVSPNDSEFSGGGLLIGQLTKVTFMSEERDSPVTSISDTNHASSEPNRPDQDANSLSQGRRSPDLLEDNSEPAVSYPLQSMPQFQLHSLPLEGCLASLSLLPSTRQFLASYRPSQRLPRVRHLLAELQQESGPPDLSLPDSRYLYTCKEIHSFWAGSRMKMLTRARLFEGPEGGITAVAGNEDVNGALVWRCDTGQRFQTIQPPDTNAECPIIDICPYSNSLSETPNLALLTERSLHLYRWHTTLS